MISIENQLNAPSSETLSLIKQWAGVNSLSALTKIIHEELDRILVRLDCFEMEGVPPPDKDSGAGRQQIMVSISLFCRKTSSFHGKSLVLKLNISPDGKAEPFTATFALSLDIASTLVVFEVTTGVGAGRENTYLGWNAVSLTQLLSARHKFDLKSHNSKILLAQRAVDLSQLRSRNKMCLFAAAKVVRNGQSVFFLPANTFVTNARLNFAEKIACRGVRVTGININYLNEFEKEKPFSENVTIVERFVSFYVGVDQSLAKVPPQCTLPLAKKSNFDFFADQPFETGLLAADGHLVIAIEYLVEHRRQKKRNIFTICLAICKSQ